ncbi:hypothetical protein [Kitasatospora sp. NPDC057223]|uniref:hypothetical protein n=1 Tax=Kitasatospora sp. NPDC057223 TaxID=3346055 RepID=UPI00363EF51A
MTSSQQDDTIKPVTEQRAFPPCRCASPRCNGRPEALLTIAYPKPPPPVGGAYPPAAPYRPTARGELVLDARCGRVGTYMDTLGGVVYLRPVSGGPEWEADPRWIVRG